MMMVPSANRQRLSSYTNRSSNSTAPRSQFIGSAGLAVAQAAERMSAHAAAALRAFLTFCARAQT